MSKTRERIHDSQLKYKQGLGQHFLYDQALLEELVAESGVTAEDDVLEIGPGSGALTQCLCRAARRVVSIELDERLIPLLTAFMEPYPNFRLIQGYAMTVDLREAAADLAKPLSVVAAEMDLRLSTQQKRAFPSSALLSLKVRDDRIGLETEVFFKRPAQRVTVLPCTPAGPEPEGRPAVPPPLRAGSWEPDVLKRSLKGTHPSPQ